MILPTLCEGLQQHRMASYTTTFTKDQRCVSSLSP